MNSPADKSKKPVAQKGSAKPASSDDRASNKVPESAENFEHILRRLVIEKTKARPRS